MTIRSVHAFGDDALANHDAVGLAEAIESGDITAAEAVGAAVDRARTVDPSIGAISEECFEQSIEAANDPGAGRFSGVPTFIKDAVHVEGMRTRHGTQAMRHATPATETGGIAQQMFDMGMICLGKSTLPEFGLTASTEFPHTDPTRNPWNLDHSAGGSSGGAAALVASGVVPIAHGGDGGGSIRIPASACGIVGLKTSRGRLLPSPLDRYLPVKIGVDGVLTRSVRDTAAYCAEAEKAHRNPALPPIGDVTAPNERRLTIGTLIESPGAGEIDEATRRAFDSTVELLEQLGHRVEPMAPPVDAQFVEDFTHYWAMLAFALSRAGTKLVDPVFDKTALTDLTHGLARRFVGKAARTPGAIARLRASAAASSRLFQTYDVVLSPTVCHVAPPIGHLSTSLPYDVLFPRVESWAGFSAWANATGAPSISLPLGRDDETNLSVGMMFGADLGRERRLLELAYQLEEAAPWPTLGAAQSGGAG